MLFTSDNRFLMRFLTPVAATLSFTLFACGGGGGGSVTDPTTAPATQTPAQTQTTTSTTLTAAPGMGENTVTWPLVEGAVSYNIYWGTARGVTSANGTKISGVNSPFVHTGLTDGVGYYYIVTAVMADGSENQPWAEAMTVAGSCH